MKFTEDFEYWFKKSKYRKDGMQTKLTLFKGWEASSKKSNKIIKHVLDENTELKRLLNI